MEKGDIYVYKGYLLKIIYVYEFSPGYIVAATYKDSFGDELTYREAYKISDLIKL